MAYKMKREFPVKGLSFTNIDDPKYRTDVIIVRMILPLTEEYMQQYHVIGNLLVESTAVNPDKAQMSERLKSLYGAEQRFSIARLGDKALFSLTLRCIGDRFAFDGEKITTAAAQLLLDMIFSPNAPDGAFKQEYFETARRDIIEAIKSSYNNRHTHAIRRAREIAFEGEAAACSVYGTIEQAEKLTAAGLYETYKKMLDTAVISVWFCGSGNNTKAQELVKERFISFAKNRFERVGADWIPEEDSFISPSPLKPEVREVRESIEQEQLKLALFFKTSGDDPLAEKIACSLYGGTAFSKLFANVREKLSLCYYCQSALIDFKNAMLVDSGVDTDNEQLARDEILRQLESLRQGDFTDEELENTKKSICGSLRIVPDAIEDINSWYFTRFAKGMEHSPAQEIEMINEVTRERVIEAYKGFKLDTVYVLEPENIGDEGGEQA